MIKSLLTISLLFFSLVPSLNSAEGGPCKDYGECDQFKPDLNNMASLQRGVGTFMKYCYSCHSLKYSRWGRGANDLQIPEDIFFEVSNEEKINETTTEISDLPKEETNIDVSLNNIVMKDPILEKEKEKDNITYSISNI